MTHKYNIVNSEKYTLDGLVTGGFNEAALAVVNGIIKNSDTAYNPVFFYSESGLGKTHILHSISNALRHDHNKKVLYLTATKFCELFIKAIQEGEKLAFQESFKEYDAFILDDVHLFSNKEKTQEELLDVLDGFLTNNKQVVLASRKDPSYALKVLEKGLLSRFMGGIILNIVYPDHEAREKIVKQKADKKGLVLFDQSVTELVEATHNCNVRELEGLLNCVGAQTAFKGEQLIGDEVALIVNNFLEMKRSFAGFQEER